MTTLEVRSLNHCCRGKANKRYVGCVCVRERERVRACGRARSLYSKQRASAMSAAPLVPPYYLINGTVFGKKLLNVKCVF